MKRAYKVVDVFSSTPLLGNPVAVVLDAEGLDDAAMQAIALWTNLSETTFLLPPPAGSAADYALRIFTPQSELPFAGHPTLGSAYAALEAGRIQPRDGRLIQACGVGDVAIAVAGDRADRRPTLTLPKAVLTPLAAGDIAPLEAVLGQPLIQAPAVVDVGPKWIVAEVEDVDALLAMTPDFAALAVLERRLAATGVTLFARRGDGHDIEVRSFAPSAGVPEDPVCGSGNGAVAVFRSRGGLLPPAGATYEARQGRAIGRDGYVAVGVDAAGHVTIGGACVTCLDGVLLL